MVDPDLWRTGDVVGRRGPRETVVGRVASPYSTLYGHANGERGSICDSQW